MILPLVQCAFCRHFHRDRRDGNFCDAFPDGDGIPSEIITNEADHRQPFPGDHGIRFDALPGEHHPFDEEAE
jgi:hypothetical protein